MGGIFKAAGDFLSDATEAVGKFVKETAKTAVDVVDTVVDFSVKTITNPRSIFDDPMKAISLAVAVVAGGGVGVAAWSTLYSGAVNTLTADMAKNGWINEDTAMILNVVGTIALAWVAGGGTAPVNSGYISAIQGLEAIGISNATANIIVGYSAEMSILLSTTTAQVAGVLYSTYQSIQQSLMLEHQYKMALAAFEKWKYDFLKAQEKSAKSDQEAVDFVSGAYYRKMAGQQLFNINLAGHERYVSTDVQKPSWGLDANPAYNVEPELAKLMWYNKQFDMAGGSSFTSMQLEVPKFTGGNYG